MSKTHDCGGCFYEKVDHREYPCNGCFMNSRFVHRDVFKDVDNSPVFKQTGKLTWEYDTVNKPKHYMLFNQMDTTAFAYINEGIEVRDVIEKLTEKLGNNAKAEFYSYQFAADYVQMMQYLMRFMDKNGVEDLKKASWYLERMIKAYGA